MNGDLPPFFLVGAPRSGTTLLRGMLDSHSRIAVPPESHFVVGLGRTYRIGFRPQAVDDLLAHPWFPSWGLDSNDLAQTIESSDVKDFAGLMDIVFSQYARTHDKQRWGDKTPWYVSYIDLLDDLFPDALFIHLVRDGREVSVSVAEQSWGPDSPVTAAFNWRKRVLDGLAAGGRLGPARYHQLRLEDLIRAPEAELTKICAFLGEDYEPGMLDYNSRAIPAFHHPAHPYLKLPPTAGLRDWTTKTSPGERIAIESVCAPLLNRLGYGPVTRSTKGMAHAYIERARYRLGHLGGIKHRLDPRREF